MKRSLMTVTVLSLLVSAGCATTGDEPVRVYTFEKERVDQKIKGNQGYLTGTAPEVDRPEDQTRTIIGVDVELPSGTVAEEELTAEEELSPGERLPVSEQVEPQEQAVTTGVQNIVQQQPEEPAKGVSSGGEQVTEEEKEEYWIK